VNCDPIARWYRWLEYIGFGRELERRRIAFLGDISDARKVLVLGEGDGRFLVRLFEQTIQKPMKERPMSEWPGVEIHYVDLSLRMLELARKRLEAAGHTGDAITFQQANALTILLPRAQYDLIVTHFFLDCFNEAEAAKLVQNISDAALPHARWLISEFRQSEVGWRAAWAWLWLRLLYLFFRVTTGLETTRLIDHHGLLLRTGFRLSRAETARFGLLVSELWVR
jgi:ubiquinone/menaquinone biosynthesis C-methylase UbiE